MTTVYLAWSPTANDTLAKHIQDAPVDLLVSYVVLKDFQKHRSRFNVRRWVMDSGAFSVANSGRMIALADYIAASKDVDAFEVFALDVIGDPRASQRNYRKTWSAGAPGIPTFHRGSDFRYLDQMMECDKIAIGGLVRASGKKRFVEQVFARVWPKRVHGFGLASQAALSWAPFDSVDASSWAYAPRAMGHWAGYTGRQMQLSCRGKTDLWIEVLEHQRRARFAASRWRRELAAL